MDSTLSIIVHALEVLVLLGGVFWKFSLFDTRLAVLERLVRILVKRSRLEDPDNGA